MQTALINSCISFLVPMTRNLIKQKLMEEGVIIISIIIIIVVMFSAIHICHGGKGMAVGMGGGWFHGICSQRAESENSRITMFSTFYF